ncbi:hypothetical protein OIU74_018125 [Salix koriyanagi]|uniref:Uncharacterized protein n=1 Tax=Salix koriyanagi TaxID=2511006 RepID=A0A9Q0WRP1_9ROSI|nr:hypothetical protein OIU74_018125 [Salix koriyanagi]
MPDIEPVIWPVCCEIVLPNLMQPVRWLDVIVQISLHFHARVGGNGRKIIWFDEAIWKKWNAVSVLAHMKMEQNSIPSLATIISMQHAL